MRGVVCRWVVVGGVTALSLFVPFADAWVNAWLGFHGMRVETAFFWIFFWLFYMDWPWIYLPAGAATFGAYLVDGVSPLAFGGILLLQIIALRAFKRRFFLDVYPTQVFFSFWILLGSYGVWLLAVFYPE